MGLPGWPDNKQLKQWMDSPSALGHGVIMEDQKTLAYLIELSIGSNKIRNNFKERKSIYS